MTWHFDPSGTTMDVYDHTGSLVAESVSFSGTWQDYPNEVTEVMREEADNARRNGNTERWRDIHIRLASSDIKEGKPP